MSTAVASARGASTGVYLAAVATGVGALPALIGLGEPTRPTGALHGAGWPAVGVGAALMLDQAGDARMGRVMAMLAMVPLVMVVIALPTSDQPVWTRVEDLWRVADIVVVFLTLVVLAWATGYTPGRTHRRRLFWLLGWSAVVLGASVLAQANLEPHATAVGFGK